MDIRPGVVVGGAGGETLEIEEAIGSGGFGVVFRAKSGVLRYAVKTVLTAGLNDDELRVLQNEARMAMVVDHPNVVRVFHFDDGAATSGQPPYLVMEYVEGGSLAGLLDAHRASGTKLAVAELRAMYLQIAKGMQAINAHVVHRDLKPANILVDSKSGALKITDFGLAKLADASTRSESFKGWGTRPYQAPEAFDGGKNTIAMDMYAAGVVFFEMAALCWPVEPKKGDVSPLKWQTAHLLSPAKSIRDFRSDLPADLEQIMVLMLQKNPVKRPPDWATVVKVLESGEAPSSGQPNVSALVGKATATVLATSASEAAARERALREEQRRGLLTAAFTEAVGVIRSVVDAFNEQSVAGKLTVKHDQPLRASVSSSTGRQIRIEGTAIQDFEVQHDGIYRLLVRVEVDPMPTAASRDQVLTDQVSFGSFNLVLCPPFREALRA